MVFESFETTSIDTQYTLNKAKVSQVNYSANELVCKLTNQAKDTLSIVFRVSNNDVAFSYRLTTKERKFHVKIFSEATGFKLPNKATTFITQQAPPMSAWKQTKPSYEEEYTFNGEQKADIIIDYLDEDDALRENIENTNFSSADHYIRPAEIGRQQNLWAYITMIIFGLTAAGAGLWASVKGTHAALGEIGPLLSSAAVALGVLLLLMGLYYLMKHLFGRS